MKVICSEDEQEYKFEISQEWLRMIKLHILVPFFRERQIQFVASWGLMLDLDGVKPSMWAFMWKSLTACWLYGCDPASTDIIAVQPARCECGQACVKQMWYNRKWVF